MSFRHCINETYVIITPLIEYTSLSRPIVCFKYMSSDILTEKHVFKDNVIPCKTHAANNNPIDCASSMSMNKMCIWTSHTFLERIAKTNPLSYKPIAAVCYCLKTYNSKTSYNDITVCTPPFAHFRDLIKETYRNASGHINGEHILHCISRA